MAADTAADVTPARCLATESFYQRTAAESVDKFAENSELVMYSTELAGSDSDQRKGSCYSSVWTLPGLGESFLAAISLGQCPD